MHGVGGSPGPRLLGYDDESETRVIATHDGVTIRERRNTARGRVQGFDWGDLNSSSRVHAAWVFLAPFTLLNAAGWSMPRPERAAQIVPMRLAHGLVTVLGWLLTLSAAAWIAEILIDIVGYQWLTARLVDGPAAGGGWDLGPWTVNFTLDSARITALVLSSATTMVLFIVGALLAGRTRRAIAEPRIDDHPFTRRSELTDRGFFSRRPSWAASTFFHLGMVACVIGATILQGADAIAAGRARTDADVTVAIVEAAQFSLLVLLLVVSLTIRLIFGAHGAGTGWALTAVASVVTGAFLAGSELWLLGVINPPDRVDPPVVGGWHLVPIDVYFWTVAAAVVIALVAVASRGRLPGLPRACSASTTPLPPRWRRLVRNAQGTARLIHKIDLFVFAFALAAVGVAVGFSVAAGTTLFERIRDGGVPPKPSGVVTDAAAWLLVAGVVFVVLRARKAASDNRTRRFIGQAWDALAFWPRRFHPFAIRPYTHIAVPALRAHLEELQVEDPVLVSAHSQDSAIAAAAILQMDDVARVGLVTYGSHLGTLYRRAFPSYFGPHQIRTLRDHLDFVRRPPWTRRPPLTPR